MIRIKGTRNYIDVYIEDKVVRINGEMIVGGFIAFKDTIKEWRIPNNIPITETEKDDIIAKVLEKTQDSHFIITFE